MIEVLQNAPREGLQVDKDGRDQEAPEPAEQCRYFKPLKSKGSEDANTVLVAQKSIAILYSLNNSIF